MNDTRPAAGGPVRAVRPRFVTAASLFDGHDASINIMRRVLQAEGAEVIHLGHDRGVEAVAAAAVQEDAHAVAISSYQGGHMEYFGYLVDRLRELGRPDIAVFGGGGGTITDREIAALHERGVARIYSVEDGRRLGLVGMIRDMIERASRDLLGGELELPAGLAQGGAPALARALTLVEALADAADEAPEVVAEARARIGQACAGAGRPLVVGITGPGGAGKSSLTDELVRRFVDAWPDRRLGVLSVDPTRKRTGGALLGDRIRMNAVFDARVFMRSMATRRANAAVSDAVRDAIAVFGAAGVDLLLLETAGIGQSGSEVTEIADVSLYVMTPEFGAPSQLEKIDMLDFADVVALNKSDRHGAADAVRHVAKQVQRNRGRFDTPPDQMPVYACSASRFGDAGVTRVWRALAERLSEHDARWTPHDTQWDAPALSGVLPAQRVRYLSEIGECVRGWRARGHAAVRAAADVGALRRARAIVGETPALEAAEGQAMTTLGPRERELLESTPALLARYRAPENAYTVRGREIRVANRRTTQSGLEVPRVCVPATDDTGELMRWRYFENVPGEFPYTTGVFAYKREGEDPTRMFAGEGGPERTNRRFHYLAQGQPAARLSTAFDSVTLYGRDPGEAPDVFGKVGNSGVSVPTLDDAKRLYSGFDLCAPSTSVSMTINGPAPVLLAMFFNTAIDQAVERRLRETGRWDDVEARLRAGGAPVYRGDLPTTHDRGGLGLLGVSGDEVVSAEEYAEIRAEVLSQVRGTVQADILKEDQAQNTCIFSTEFALKMMGDIQEYFVANNVRNFYSVSISGYHIAEAGANPITQLAFTLANGFTLVEYFRAREMRVDDFARNLSFFFSNGLDPEYTVIGRVARRIWAVAMRDLYGADERSQQLKYHIQTSGRSLHAQEIDFNDIRTTLQAMYAIADNCNSLHTNAYDEAITTPTSESVRRALAIQLILNREFGLFFNENPLQGAYVVDVLTDLVEEAVLAEFDRLTERGGVLGAMELMYQRSRIQEESLLYEQRKHSGEIPIIGVNTFLAPDAGEGVVEVELARSTDDEKHAQIEGVRAFQARNAERAPAALARLRAAALRGENLFAELMEAVKVCSLGQITDALFAVGGEYRRNM
jgi:methylmalonyl-CoA mutase